MMNNAFGLQKASKQMVALMLPIVGSRFANALNLFIAMLLIARLGRAQLAAGALVTSISTLLFIIVWSVLFSVGVVVGREYGAKKDAELGMILRSSFLLGAITGLPVIILMLNIAPILRFFGQDPRLISLVQQYFNGLAWAVLPSAWSLACSQFVIALGRPRMALFWSILTPIFMLVPGYGLLFGKFGLPKVGMAGMAYANVFMAWAIFIFAIVYLAKPCFKKYRIFTLVNPINTMYLNRLFKIGYPISVQFGAELAAFSLLTIFIGWIGRPSLAAWQVVIQLNMLVIMIPYGIAQASGILIGQSIGCGHESRARVLGYAGLLLGGMFMCLVLVVYLFLPRMLVHFYLGATGGETSHIMHVAILLLAVGAFSQLFDGIRNIITGALRGFHDTKVPMYYSIVAIWIFGIPISYFLGFILGWGAVGISCGFLSGVFILTIILFRRFHEMSATSAREECKYIATKLCRGNERE